MMEVDTEVTVTVTCPDCGTEFEEDVWVTIEVERDDFP